MTSTREISGVLRPLLRKLLQGTYEPQDLNCLARLCQSMALARVNTRIGCGTFRPELYGLRPTDVAYDCLADLFQEDESGKLVHLAAYFEGINLETIDDERLLIHLRRLVFATVNQGIMRTYQEHDPGLSKILRNIRLAAHSVGSFVETERFGERCIGPGLCPLLEDLPLPDVTTLARGLAPYVSGNERTPALLSRVSIYLREQSDHCRLVPVVTLALALREVFAAKQPAQLLAQPESDLAFGDEAARIITATCDRLRGKTIERYRRMGKVTVQDLNAYLAVIERMLTARFVHANGDGMSLFHELSALMPGLSDRQYRKTHRGKLEYLHRVASRDVARRLRAG